MALFELINKCKVEGQSLKVERKLYLRSARQQGLPCVIGISVVGGENSIRRFQGLNVMAGVRISFPRGCEAHRRCAERSRSRKARTGEGVEMHIETFTTLELNTTSLKC